MKSPLLPALATCVLAQALPTAAAAQFTPNPINEYVTARLEVQGAQAFATPIDYASLDSTALFLSDGNDVLQRVGSAVFTNTGNTLRIVQQFVDDDGPYRSEVTANLNDPTDGALSLPVAVSYRDGGVNKQVTLDNRGNFVGGLLRDSEVQTLIRSFVDIVVTGLNTYRYDGEGRLAEQVTEFEAGGFRTPEDSTVYAYGADGRLATSRSFSYVENDDGTGGDYEDGQSITWNYIDETHVEGRVTVEGGSDFGTFVYRFRGAVLDSFYLRSAATGAPFLGIFRSDDRATDNIRQYDYLFVDSTSGTPEPTITARSIQYFNGATSVVAGLPQVAGEIVAANPTRGGAVVRFEGDAPAGARWRLVSADGRVVDSREATEQYALPELSSGVYVLNVSAPGYAQLGKVLVVE